MSAVLAFGAVAAGPLWHGLSNVDPFQALLLSGLLSLAVVAGVLGYSHVRARARWEAAWEAYVAQELARAPLAPAEEAGEFSLARTR
jgi:high-affinity Fe2+/Pb2+ permease